MLLPKGSFPLLRGAVDHDVMIRLQRLLERTIYRWAFDIALHWGSADSEYVGEPNSHAVPRRRFAIACPVPRDPSVVHLVLDPGRVAFADDVPLRRHGRESPNAPPTASRRSGMVGQT